MIQIIVYTKLQDMVGTQKLLLDAARVRMDPLSITVSAITIAATANSIANDLRGLRHLNDDVSSLIDDVSDLRLVLLEVDFFVRENLDRARPSGQFSSALQNILTSARSKVLELDKLIHFRLLRPQTPGSNIKVSRVAWLKEKARVKALQKGIKTSKLDLTVLLGVITWSAKSSEPSLCLIYGAYPCPQELKQ